jgi:hypothetical protein
MTRWRGLSRGRRRALVAVAAGAAAVLIALIVVPGPAPAQSASGVTGHGPAPTASVLDPGSVDTEDATLAADDPVAATTVLLARRERCYRELSVACLDGVAQDGSAALDADRAAIREVLDGGELPTGIDAGAVTPTLAERLGDTALIDLGVDATPASILLMKDEAGWRIRDYVAPN